MLVIRCKGTNKWAQYKTKMHFFVFIVERKYLRTQLKGTKRRAKCKRKWRFSCFLASKLGCGYNNLLVLGMFLIKTSLIICWFDLLLLTLRVITTIQLYILWTPIVFTPAQLHGRLSLRWALDSNIHPTDRFYLLVTGVRRLMISGTLIV